MNEITATIFRNGKVIDRVSLDASMPQEGESGFIWIEVLNPLDSDFAVLQERFRLHSLAVADSMGPSKLPKIDAYDDQIFTVLKIARLQDDEIEYDDIDASRCAMTTVPSMFTPTSDLRADYSSQCGCDPTSSCMRP